MRLPILSLLASLVLPASVSFAQTSVEDFKALSWDTTHRGDALDLSKYKETFRDDFNTLSVTAEGGKGPWFSPGHSSYGVSKFVPPGADGPFSVADGKLTIRAEKKKDPKGKDVWTSSSMQTVDGKGQGFAQTYGYFEASMKVPAGAGPWPAFWLLSQNGYLDKTKTRAELDVVEWYGGDPKGLHSTPHLWPAGQPPEGYPLKEHICRSIYYDVTSLLINKRLDGFHTYGAEVTPDWYIVYFDRKETGRFKCLPEFKTPLYMVVTLALTQPKDNAPIESPKDLVVDYVAAYAPVAAAQ